MTLKSKEKIGLWLVALITFGATIGLWVYGPIQQSQHYHAFVDNRVIWGIPNFFDVISNLAFILVGLLGLYKTLSNDQANIATENKLAYQVFFLGVALVGVGSGYYHLSPTNETLVWDRIPMTIAFMALCSIIIAEYISPRLSSVLLFPLVTIGILSVLYWHWTETVGRGDLRPYILVQFLPMLLIPIIIICFKSSFTHVGGYWILFSAYIVAKIFEHFDKGFFAASGLISGHSLKHVVAALGIYGLLISFGRRRLVES